MVELEKKFIEHMHTPVLCSRWFVLGIYFNQLQLNILFSLLYQYQQATAMAFRCFFDIFPLDTIFVYFCFVFLSQIRLFAIVIFTHYFHFYLSCFRFLTFFACNILFLLYFGVWSYSKEWTHTSGQGNEYKSKTGKNSKIGIKT